MDKNKITIKVLGPETPCKNCMSALKNVKEAIQQLSIPDHDFEVKHENMASRENIETFGLLKGPAIVAQEHVLFQGSVPAAGKIVKKIKELIKLIEGGK
ncbi:MAG: thioredoxin family protein [Promethearchaeota archaeon]